MTLDNTPLAIVTAPIGLVSEPFDITGTATFKPTLSATKGTIGLYVNGVYSGYTKTCTSETCNFSYNELAGKLYDLNHGGPYAIKLTATGGGTSTNATRNFSVNKTPTVSVTSPLGMVSGPFDITGTATFKPTLSATKGTIGLFVNGVYSGYTKICTTETCNFSYNELAGKLYDLNHGGPYAIKLTATGGGTSTDAPRNFSVNKTPTVSVTSPLGMVSGLFDITGTATFKPTLSATKGTIGLFVNGVYSGYTKTCTTETCNFSYNELAGKLYDLNHGGPYAIKLTATGGGTSTNAPSNFSVNKTPTVSVSAPIGTVSGQFDITGTATFKSTLSATKGTLALYVKGVYSGYTKTCNTETCNFSYKELAGKLYSLAPGGPYSVKLTASGGGATASDTKIFSVVDCDLKVDSFTGTNTELYRGTGGNVLLSGAISDSSGKQVNWDSSVSGRNFSGSGKAPSINWDGKLANGKVETGSFTATLHGERADNPACDDSKSLNFTVAPTANPCKLKVTFGSSANVAGGELTDSLPLFSLPGNGPNLGLTLHYASLDNFSGALGLGWSHNFESSLRLNDFGEAIVRLGDGSDKLYTPDGNGGFISQPGDYATLAKNPDGSFTRSRRDGTRELYAAAGQLLSITDRNGNALTFVYAGGLLQTVSDTAGRSVSFAYDSAGHLASVADPAGQFYDLTVGETLESVTFPDGGAWRYGYAANAFLTAKTDPLDHLTTYTYDDQHRIVSSIDPEGRSRAITYPSGDETVRTTIFTEKDGGVWLYTYDTAAGDLLAKTDPIGNVTSYTYDANHNQLSKTDASGTATSTYDALGNLTTATDVAGQMTSYTYNVFGQVTSITAPDGGVTRYEYDEHGNLTFTTDASGATTGYSYDDNGNVLSVTDTAGRTTTMTYDVGGRVSSTTTANGEVNSFTYDVAGNLTSQTDANNMTTQFVYDARNRLVKVTDPAGNVSTFGYDDSGNKIFQTDAAGTTRFEYNAQGQLVKIIDPLGNVTSYAYGGSGCPACGGGTDKLTSVTDANGNTIRFEYDALGRKVKEIDPLGNAVSYTYDASGNVLTRTDASARLTSFVYDLLGRVKEQIDPMSGRVRFAYDTAGRLTQVVDPIGVVTSYEYDAVGRLLRSDSPDAGSAVYTYNPDGSLKTKTDANDTTISYSYDTADRLLEVRYPNASENVTYTYDVCSNGKGRVCGMNDASGTTIYSYDNLGRIVAEQKTVLAVTYTTRYEYHQTGQLKAITYPSGRRVEYAYDQLQRPTTVTAKLKDLANLANSIAYDRAGNPTSLTFGNNLKSSWAYDPANRVKSIAVPGIVAYSYTYDPAGNIASIADSIIPSISKSYIYDSLDRLTSATGPWGTLAWRYDANGNRQAQQNGVKYSYSYDGNRLKSVANGHIDYYRYDKVGNTTSDGRQDFVYNQNNRLIEALENGHTLGEYIFNGKGQRVVKRTGPAATNSSSGQTVIYHYDLVGKLIEETSGNGKLLVDYVYLGSQPLAQIRKQGNGEETFYYHNDHLGTPKVMTDKLGKVVWDVEFDPFGNEVQLKGRQGSDIRNVGNNFRAPGQYFDVETGLHQNGFRDYDPRKGRYIEVDPIGLRGGLNPFVYVQNGPVTNIDSLGLQVTRCSRKLGDKNQPPTNNNWYNLLRHDYLNISGTILSFQAGNDMFWSQGWVDNNEYQDNGGCEIVCDDDNFDKYVLDAAKYTPIYNVWAYPGTATYLLGARNCQTWANEVIGRAKINYLNNETCKRCFQR